MTLTFPACFPYLAYTFQDILTGHTCHTVAILASTSDLFFFVCCHIPDISWATGMVPVTGIAILALALCTVCKHSWPVPCTTFVALYVIHYYYSNCLFLFPMFPSIVLLISYNTHHSVLSRMILDARSYGLVDTYATDALNFHLVCLFDNPDMCCTGHLHT